MTLEDWINLKSPGYFMENDRWSEKLCSLKVVQEFKSHETGFPQTRNRHRNVHIWVLLDDGSAVGMNESPRSGITFVRIGPKTVARFPI